MADVVDDLDQIGFLLGRAYYSYVGLLQQWLESAGLAEHLKPGMGSLLFALFRQDGRTITEIADELQANGTATTRTKQRQTQRARVMHARLKQRSTKHSEKTG